jgi:transaldolase / glucose-6-phosphate isomerase
LTTLASGQIASRIWRREPGVFVGARAPENVQEAINGRLGWLNCPAAIPDLVERLQEFTDSVRADGLTDVFLVGMGGSSLCAEVFRDIPSVRSHSCRLAILDTTDERTIRAATESLNPARSLFIIGSKSGTTIEVTALERHFFAVMSEHLDGKAGPHFVAITDPGTALERLAIDRRYRDTFINPPDIGGRYSALSLFGLVPAALLGLDIVALGRSAERMAVECRSDTEGNPGLILGSFMAQHAAEGRDKLTLLLSEDLAPLGAWIEQLVAESTGKDGRGLLPVVGEPPGAVEEYGADRAFVSVSSAPDRAANFLVRELEQAGRPVLRIATSPMELGAEFFRWEFATAVAGAALAMNPFDEPNVRDAKQRTQAQLDAKTSIGSFRLEPPFERGEGYSRREFRPAWQPSAPRQRYLAVLDYLPADDRRPALISRLRASIRKRSGLATTHGVGPRYLHSTGQFHKGGPNCGVFVLLTAADASATPIPGMPFTFSTLKQAQALGDFEALVANGREVVHYHLDDPAADFTTVLERLLDRLGKGRT